MYLKHSVFGILLLLISSCSKKTESSLTNYKDLNGNAVALADFKGKNVILNFWATWCLPCVEEMPSMANAQQKLVEDNFVFLFATTDELSKINEFRKKHNYPFQFLRYQKTLDNLNIHALPVTFIYNTNGSLVKRIDGAKDWNSKELLNLLKSVK